MQKKLSIYIHIPFCVRKCLYCDFLSAPSDELTKQAYVQSLLAEIEQKAADYKDFCIQSVFIGGGTPSVLPESDIDSIMRQLRKYYTLAQEAEISIEINPGTVNREKLDAYWQSGIRRISIGLQSAQNKELSEIGRIHTYEDFLVTFHAAREAGFSNINIDLMSALPGQTVLSYQDTLVKIVKLLPEHISAYSLILEEGTPFYARYGTGNTKETLPGLPDEATEREMYDLTGEVLTKAGYHRYEISNYALPGMECRHNAGYWKRVNYLGFGIGAASLVENERWNNTRELNAYIERQFSKKNIELLETREQMEEFMFLGLRLIQGVSEEQFKINFDVEMDSVYGKTIQKLVHQGLLARTESGYIRLTGRGIDISNYVMSEFIF